MTALSNTPAREVTSLWWRSARGAARRKKVEGFDGLDLVDRGLNKQWGRLTLPELPVTLAILKPRTRLPPVPLNPGISS
jgi:hypothetical protein